MYCMFNFKLNTAPCQGIILSNIIYVKKKKSEVHSDLQFDCENIGPDNY